MESSRQQQQLAMMAQVMQLMPRNDLGQLAQLAQLQQGKQTQRDNQQRLAMAQQALEENMLQGQFGRETGRADLGLRRAAGGRAEQALRETAAQNQAVNTRANEAGMLAMQRLLMQEEMLPYQQRQAGSATALQNERALKERFMNRWMQMEMGGGGGASGEDTQAKVEFRRIFQEMIQNPGVQPQVFPATPAPAQQAELWKMRAPSRP